MVLANAFGSGSGGNIKIEASESIALPENQSNVSFALISASTFNSGEGGEINISTQKLAVLDGGVIGSTSFNTGDAGSVEITANDINVSGTKDIISQEQPVQSLITSGTLAEGNAGSVSIDAARLNIKDGAAVSSSSLGTGNAGSVSIDASELVEINDENSRFSRENSVSSSVVAIPQDREVFEQPQPNTAKAGDVRIETSVLNVFNGGTISVFNQGIGEGGEIKITTETINLEEGGNITAIAESGDGGNIQIDTSNLTSKKNSQITANTLLGEGGDINLRGDRFTLNSSIISASANEDGGNISLNASDLDVSDSQIEAESLSRTGGNITVMGDRTIFQNSNLSASAARQGDGGNVTIDADTVLGVNSDLTATAVRGDGGNILIDADGVLGFAERLAVDNDGISDVDATSQFGTDGTVNITNPLTTTNDPLVVLATVPQRNYEIPLTNDCYNNAGEAKLTDSTHENIPESRYNYLDRGNFMAEGNNVEKPSTPSPSSSVIEELLWQPGDPYEDAIADTQVQTPDGRIFAVNKEQVMKLQQRGCIQLEVIE